MTCRKCLTEFAETESTGGVDGINLCQDCWEAHADASWWEAVADLEPTGNPDEYRRVRRLKPGLLIGIVLGLIVGAIFGAATEYLITPAPKPGTFEGRQVGHRIFLPPAVFDTVDQGLHQDGRVEFYKDEWLR